MNNINKFKEVIEKHELDINVLRDIMLSLAIADFTDGTNEKKLDVDRVCSSRDSDWAEVVTFLSLSPTDAEVLPYVQRLRLMCDTLSIATKLDGVYLTMPESKVIANLCDVSLSAQDYCDEDDCIRLLNLMLENKSEDSNESEDSNLDEAFEYIKSNLQIMKRIDNSLGKKAIFAKHDFSSVYLDGDYSVVGFNTSDTVPPRLLPAEKFEDFSYYVEMTFVREVVASVVNSLIDGDNSDFGVTALIYGLEKLKKKANDIIPIGIACNVSEIKSITVPYYSNPVAQRYIDDIFSSKGDLPLSKQAVSQVYELIKIKYPKLEVTL